MMVASQFERDAGHALLAVGIDGVRLFRAGLALFFSVKAAGPAEVAGQSQTKGALLKGRLPAESRASSGSTVPPSSVSQ